VSTRDDVLLFLRKPQVFAQGGSLRTQELWQGGLEQCAEPLIAARGGRPLRPAQVDAWRGIAKQRAALLLGPPGTGKTFALAWMALGYVEMRRRAGLPARVLVTAFTRNAIANLLEAIKDKADQHLTTGLPVRFLGNSRPAGMAGTVEHLGLWPLDAAREALEDEHVVVGTSVWSLFKVLDGSSLPGQDGPCARVFDLVCIDEASQIILGQGLLALAGLALDGRVLVAGDNKQLPPIAGVHDHVVDGRPLGVSLYDFLKQSEVAEFALNETFRLNGPLTVFPERTFYRGRYCSAVPESRLALRDGWQAGLADWERYALDPEHPLCVLLHDGPVAGTQNPFEVRVVARLVELLRERLLPDATGKRLSADVLWQERLAIVSPHRAQNVAIRAALGDPRGSECVVETVDRIQGRERDSIIASYTVADPEFALAEGGFIFSPERLNVTVTRARTKLIVVVSRRLLEVTPSDEEVFDAAQLLREFVFSTEEAGLASVPDGQGREWSVAVRVRRFSTTTPLAQLKPGPAPPPAPALTPALREIVDTIRLVAAKSQYGTAADYEIKKALFRKDPIPFAHFHALVRGGWITLDRVQGKFGDFWSSRPIQPQRLPWPGDDSTVRERIEEAIQGARRGRSSPRYVDVRSRFVWVDETGADVLLPVIDDLVAKGSLVRTLDRFSRVLIDVAEAVDENPAPIPTPPEPLSEDDFVVLNALEDLEARRINFGVFESWTREHEFAKALGSQPTELAATLGRLDAHGFLLRAEDGRLRSRMAELAREVRYVKQRFAPGDADRRPFLVRSIKVELKERDKPERDVPLQAILDDAVAACGDTEDVRRVLAGIGTMLRDRWRTESPTLAAFQHRAMVALLGAWTGRKPDHDTYVITADTGSGKTEAACLPLIAGTALDHLRGVAGTRAVLVYPRVRLGANQAQRLAGYLSALARVEGLPTLTIGLQNHQVPNRFDYLDDEARKLWEPVAGSDARAFPFFGCPECDGRLELAPGAGVEGADRLTCVKCRWSYAGWVGTKNGLRARPPHFFLPVTESLHQWLMHPPCGRVFGDDAAFAPPRAVLADEIHLYSHAHGAQVGYALRRLLARAALNTGLPGRERVRPLAIGMSATLGAPGRVWGTLVGRPKVAVIRPEPAERRPNPRAREYFYFVQPEVESRGRDIAGASTTIQTLMCLAHGMRRRTGKAGGYRGIAFLDSIDKLKRMHGDFQDAEEGRRLAQLRTYLYDDDAGTQMPRRECCGQPTTCDAFQRGECWYFAARDAAQWTARGPYKPRRSLRVCTRPIFSGTRGKVEDLIRESDLVFATSSLEVGYDDPDMMLVYQHYAPLNLASFVQRKGRGGRGADDRPVTGVTLSIYSPRDTWYFRRPRRMLDAADFEVPLNLDNYFVCRGQALAAVLDVVARKGGNTSTADPSALLRRSPDVARLARRVVDAVLGEGGFGQLGYATLTEFWEAAWRTARGPASSDSPREWARVLPWVPRALFEALDPLRIEVSYPDDGDKPASTQEDIGLALSECAPGNVTRRFGQAALHWLQPTGGRAPLLPVADYANGVEEFAVPGALAELPLDARSVLGATIHPVVVRPLCLPLVRAGKMFGAEWVPSWRYDEAARNVVRIPDPRPADINPSLLVNHKSRGELRGFSIVQTSEVARAVTPPGCDRMARDVLAFVGGAASTTGLTVTRVYWGVDASIKLEDPRRPDVGVSQLFVHPASGLPALHGYQVATEGVQLRLNSTVLDQFVDTEIERLGVDNEDGRWHRGQLLRYMLESRCTRAGLNTYEARRVADLLVAAAGDADLRKQLDARLRAWDVKLFGQLLQAAFVTRLGEHPLLTERRVATTATAIADAGPKFRAVLEEAMQAAGSRESLRGYVRSVVLHGVAIRFKQAFVLRGRSEERRVLLHVKLPLQFGADAADVITVCESGAQGDGTTRIFLEHVAAVVEDWRAGGLAECANAREDAIVEAVLQRTDRHAEWRSWDPRDDAQMTRLAAEVGADAHAGAMQTVLRLLYGTESVGAERVALLDLSCEVHAVRARLAATMRRKPSAWELVSAAVREARTAAASVPRLAALLASYAGIDDAVDEESLSPGSRLADQVYRLSSSLCVDGCQACLHGRSDLMPDSLAEAATSRGLLARYSAHSLGGVLTTGR
jgi:hypothetical protein